MTTNRPKFTEWLANRLGTNRWCVARASSKRRERYDLFLSPKSYKALEAEYVSIYGTRY